MKGLFTHPLFMLGLGLRLLLIALLTPVALTDWYVPFISTSLEAIGYDPWATWISRGGVPEAFPYGYAMWLIFLPFMFFAKLLSIPLVYGYALTILFVDSFLLALINLLLPNRQRLVLLAYWLSPIVILASYGFGYNDLIPVAMLTLSLYLARHVRLAASGAALGAAISAKLSMIIALPFFIVYLYNNRALRQHLFGFIKGLGVMVLLLGLPFLFSENALSMLLNNPEMDKVYHLSVSMGNRAFLYIVPLSYLIMLYLFWRVRRLNFELFHATMGMSFLLIVLMTPASLGWYIWIIPFFAFYQAISGHIAVALIWLFSALYVVSSLVSQPVQLINGGQLNISDLMSPQFSQYILSILHTLMVATGLILSLRIWREAISHNDYFRLSRKPFVIGIAGDSGAGKDTFAEAVSGLFGGHSVVKLSGDDYHLWDRHKPMWQVMTHLNPMANDLEGFCSDVISLSDGKSVLSRHYDHHTGKMSKPLYIKSNDFIIASGLHALYLPLMRDCYNLKVYLDIDEGLRRYFKLKRDLEKRGHSEEQILKSITKREVDSERFIKPQAKHADLILSVQPIHPRMLDELDDKLPLRLKLMVRTRHSFNEVGLTRVLVGVCGLHVDIVIKDEGPEVLITIEGDTSAEDIALAAKMLCPQLIEFLDIQPDWKGGVLGLMQLIALSHINQALTKRFIQ